MVKSILSCVVLMVLCFVVGSLITESYVASAGVIALLVGCLFMLVMGERSWVLIFLLPPILSVLPLGALRGLPLVYVVSIGVLAYWCLLWAIGRVKFCWRSMWMVDIVLLIMFGLMVAAYIRRPVSILALGMDFDTVGGKVYLYCLAAMFCYVTVSAIPMQVDKLIKVLKWAIYLTLLCALCSAMLGLVGIKGAMEVDEDLVSSMSGSRYMALMGIGTYGVYYIFARFPLLRIITSPVLIFSLLCSFAAVMLSGFRARSVILGLNVAAMSFVKKDLSLLLVLSFLAYGGLLVLSYGGMIDALPYGIQRSLSIIPGVSVGANIERDADDSVDWRVVMWEWAMDPRTGYIRDYMWGDGFGQSWSETQREQRAVMRREVHGGDQEIFAARGLWHSGWITAIHRLGIVGLSVISVYYLVVVFMIFRTGIGLRNTPLFVPTLFYVFPLAFVPLQFFVSAGTIEGLYAQLSSVAYMKLFYCEGVRAGWIKPWTWRRIYVPLMIQDHGDRIRPV